MSTIRVFPQKAYLLVDADSKPPGSRLVTLPDLKNAYEVRPWSFLSKNDFSIKFSDGQVSEVTSNQDSTAALALLQKIVEVGGQLAGEALKAAGAAATGAAAKAAANIEMTTTFGLPSGIYEFDEKGELRKLQPK